MEGNLNLFDLECILIENDNFDIELNEQEIFNVDADWLWYEIHNNKILEANTCGDNMVYIKYIKENLEENELILFLEEMEDDDFGIA